jgi:hypothetical protein
MEPESGSVAALEDTGSRSDAGVEADAGAGGKTVKVSSKRMERMIRRIACPERSRIIAWFFTYLFVNRRLGKVMQGNLTHCLPCAKFIQVPKNTLYVGTRRKA